MANEKIISTSKKLLAGWKVQQPDGAGPVYYFYPDGVLVIQSPRRREFVKVGMWTMDKQFKLILFNVEPRNTTLSPDQIKEISDRQKIFTLVLESNISMRWTSADGENLLLHRTKQLPNRKKSWYWGFRNRDDNSGTSS